MNLLLMLPKSNNCRLFETSHILEVILQNRLLLLTALFSSGYIIMACLDKFNKLWHDICIINK